MVLTSLHVNKMKLLFHYRKVQGLEEKRAFAYRMV